MRVKMAFSVPKKNQIRMESPNRIRRATETGDTYRSGSYWVMRYRVFLWHPYSYANCTIGFRRKSSTACTAIFKTETETAVQQSKLSEKKGKKTFLFLSNQLGNEWISFLPPKVMRINMKTKSLEPNCHCLFHSVILSKHFSIDFSLILSLKSLKSVDPPRRLHQFQ